MKKRAKLSKKKVRLAKNEELVIKIPHLKKQLLITATADNYEIVSYEAGEEYKVVCKTCNFEDFEKYIAYKLLVELFNTMTIKDKVFNDFNKIIDEMFYKIYGHEYDDFFSKIEVETNFLIEKC